VTEPSGLAVLNGWWRPIIHAPPVRPLPRTEMISRSSRTTLPPSYTRCVRRGGRRVSCCPTAISWPTSKRSLSVCRSSRATSSCPSCHCPTLLSALPDTISRSLLAPAWPTPDPRNTCLRT
jgi:hypothetical protein